MAAKTKHITIDPGIRACINCMQYRQYFRESYSELNGYPTVVPVSTGYCLLHDQQRGALRQPCRDYATKENAPAGATNTCEGTET